MHLEPPPVFGRTQQDTPDQTQPRWHTLDFLAPWTVRSVSFSSPNGSGQYLLVSSLNLLIRNEAGVFAWVHSCLYFSASEICSSLLHNFLSSNMTLCLTWGKLGKPARSVGVYKWSNFHSKMRRLFNIAWKPFFSWMLSFFLLWTSMNKIPSHSAPIIFYIENFTFSSFMHSCMTCTVVCNTGWGSQLKCLTNNLLISTELLA